MNINLLELLDDKKVAISLMDEMKENGPWHSKHSGRERLNCFLNFKLSGYGKESIELREYLTIEDREDLWLSNLQLYVLPFIAKECYV